MAETKKILITKMTLLLTAAMVLLCGACSLDKDNLTAANVEATSDVIITNDIEITIKTLCIICEKVENISARIAGGQALGIEISDDGKQWSHVFDTELLSGKIIVDIEQSADNLAIIKNIDCSNLKIHYSDAIWLKLFGTIIVEDINEDRDKVTTNGFGYNNNLVVLPQITINSDYRVARSIRSGTGHLVNVLAQGSSYGESKQLGTYSQTITSDLKIDETTYNIIAGKMIIYLENVSEINPIEVTYSATGRTIKYKGNENRTYYK